MAGVSNNKISTFLWYENRAEEAANFYVYWAAARGVGSVTRAR